MLHTMIATILLLDRASIIFTLLFCQAPVNALDQAYSEYKSSHSHDAVKEQFLLPLKQYSISQITEFILSHRLQ